MAYPTEYQDAEHRRALGTLMNDLEALPPIQPEGATQAEGCTDAMNPDEVSCSSDAGVRAVIGESGAEIHLRAVKRMDVEVAQQAAN